MKYRTFQNPEMYAENFSSKVQRLDESIQNV